MSAAKHPKVQSDNGPKPRSVSRLAAVQALYQMDMAGTDLSDVIDEFVEQRLVADADAEGADANGLDGADATFFADILRGVVRRQRDIDPMIDEQLATGWRLVRVDSILRAILRGGVFELLERQDVPARVVINEYINVAHAFFNDEEPKVVNGIGTNPIRVAGHTDAVPFRNDPHGNQRLSGDRAEAVLFFLEDHGFSVQRHLDTASEGFGSLQPLVKNDPQTGSGPRNRRVEVVVQRISYLKHARSEAMGPLGSNPAGAVPSFDSVAPKITP